MFRIWLDDERKAPEGYIHFHSVNETRDFIQNHDHAEFLLDLDHDLGIYSQDGGDAIKLIHWLLENGYNENKDYEFTFRFHTQNVVGRINMEALVQRYF